MVFHWMKLHDTACYFVLKTKSSFHAHKKAIIKSENDACVNPLSMPIDVVDNPVISCFNLETGRSNKKGAWQCKVPA